MDASPRGAGQSTIVSEMIWAARLRGDVVREFLVGCLSFSRLLLPQSRER